MSDQQPKLTTAEVDFFTEHLAALMNHPKTPDSFLNGLVDAMSYLESEVTVKANNPEVIRQAVKAYATDGFTVEFEQPETVDLADLISAVYKHPETPVHIVDALDDAFAYVNKMDFESPGHIRNMLNSNKAKRYTEHYEAARNADREDFPSKEKFAAEPDMEETGANNAEPLIDSVEREKATSLIGQLIFDYRGNNFETDEACQNMTEFLELIGKFDCITQLKDFVYAMQCYTYNCSRDFSAQVKRFTENRTKQHTTPMFESAPQLKPVKKLLAEILAEMGGDSDAANKLICFINEIEKLDALTLKDFGFIAKEYLFTWTKDFDRAVEDYAAKITAESPKEQSSAAGV
jgi:hypothetical protein